MSLGIQWAERYRDDWWERMEKRNGDEEGRERQRERKWIRRDQLHLTGAGATLSRTSLNDHSA